MLRGKKTTKNLGNNTTTKMLSIVATFYSIIEKLQIQRYCGSEGIKSNIGRIDRDVVELNENRLVVEVATNVDDASFSICSMLTSSISSEEGCPVTV